MNNKYKICVYVKNREKPIILTDSINKDNSYEDTVKFFGEAMTKKNEVVTLDFMNDNLILNLQDIDGVVISKPQIDDVDIITSDIEDDADFSKEDGDESSKEDDAFEDTDDEIQVVVD